MRLKSIAKRTIGQQLRLRGRLLWVLSGVPALLFAAPVQADVQHVVAKGHTLQAIANRYHVSVRAILDRNHMASPKTLQPGETLIIPVNPPAARAGHGHAPAGHAGAVPPAVGAAPVPAPGVPAPGRPGHPAAAPAPALAPLLVPRVAEPPARHPTLADARRGYVAAPATPGVIHVRRLVNGEDFQIAVGSRGHTPRLASSIFQRMMRSPAGQVHGIDPRLVALLGIVSDHFGSRKIEVVSGFRPFTTKQFTPHSNHNHGKAVDFRVVGVPNEAARDFCRTLRNTGCGYYPNSVFVHMDVRGSSAYWIDYSKPGEAPRYHAPNVDADEGTSDVHADDATLPGATTTAIEPAPEATSPPAAAAAVAPVMPAPTPGAPQ